MALVTKDGFWGVNRWVKGRGHKIDSAGFLPSKALKKGHAARNHIKVVVDGDALTFCINGESASRPADISAYEISDGGDFGVFAGGFFSWPFDESSIVHMSYEQFLVWKP